MATANAIAAIGRAILALIAGAVPRDEFAAAQFELYQAKDFQSPMEEGISLYLYRITSAGEIRSEAPPAERVASGSPPEGGMSVPEPHFAFRQTFSSVGQPGSRFEIPSQRIAVHALLSRCRVSFLTYIWHLPATFWGPNRASGSPSPHGTFPRRRASSYITRRSCRALSCLTARGGGLPNELGGGAETADRTTTGNCTTTTGPSCRRP